MLRHDHKRRSKIQEARAARDFGGRTQPASGSQWHSKGDVRTPKWLIECKTTTKNSYSLKAETWRKIETEAMLDGRDALMEIEFIDWGVSLIVLDKNDFLALMNYDKELQDLIGTET